MPIIEFTGSEGGGFENLPVGTGYNFRIKKAEAKPTKNGEGSTLHVTCEVIDGPLEGRKQTLFCTLKHTKGWQLGGLLSAAIPGKYEQSDRGTKDDDGKPIFHYRFDTDDLVDATFTADIVHRKDNMGNEQVDFRKIRPTDGGESAPASTTAAGAAQAPAQSQEAPPSLRRRQAG